MTCLFQVFCCDEAKRKKRLKIFNTTAKGTMRHTSSQFKWRRVVHGTLQLRLVCVRIELTDQSLVVVYLVPVVPPRGVVSLSLSLVFVFILRKVFSMIWFFLVLLLYWCFTCCFSSFFLFLKVLDKVSVFFVRWFWRPFFEQVVYAVRVSEVTSVRDVLPVVKRRFRLFA